MLPGWIQRARDKWHYRGATRPSFADDPGPGQESVWDYPRPPALVPDPREVRVRASGDVLAKTLRSVRILETASPPTFYLPPEDVRRDALRPRTGSSFCEWKGEAQYWSTLDSTEVIAWSYPEPLPGFEALAGWFSFYPGRIDCTVDGIRVEPQPGGFYGGWVTPELSGPFKGEPGSEAW